MHERRVEVHAQGAVDAPAAPDTGLCRPRFRPECPAERGQAGRAEGLPASVDAPGAVSYPAVPSRGIMAP